MTVWSALLVAGLACVPGVLGLTCQYFPVDHCVSTGCDVHCAAIGKKGGYCSSTGNQECVCYCINAEGTTFDTHTNQTLKFAELPPFQTSKHWNKPKVIGKDNSIVEVPPVQTSKHWNNTIVFGKDNSIVTDAESVTGAPSRIEYWSNDHCGGRMCGVVYKNTCTNHVILIKEGMFMSVQAYYQSGTMYLIYYTGTNCQGAPGPQMFNGDGCFPIGGVFDGCEFTTEESRL